MKGTRINKIKDFSNIKLDCDEYQYSIHPYEGKTRNGTKVVIEALIFSLIAVFLFVAALLIPLVLNLGDSGIIKTALIATPILFIAIAVYIIINNKRFKITITTYVCDKISKTLYTVFINPDRSFGRTISGDYISVPDVDKALRDAKNKDRLMRDVLLTAKNINVIDLWHGGDIVLAYGNLELYKEDEKFLYVKASLVNKKGTTYDHPRKKKIKIPKAIKDISTVRQIIY